MPTNSFIPGADTVRAYRDSLGCFATGVTVVTTLTEAGPLAITVNSFTSVSIEPPLLLWCPDRNSLRHDAFVAAERFAIHVLAEDQLEQAKHFARDAEGFTENNWHRSEAGTPALDGYIARFECQKFATYPGGDHSIILGQVHSVSTRPGNGLVFKRGQFGGFLEQL
jgi:flavin reductase (DIM6/NTAB) family NADH-FMN oxidoreductase RutF